MTIRRYDESGVAMVVAVMILMITTSLATVGVALAVHNLNGAGVDRKRIQAVSAADGGIDLALSEIQSGAQAALPCSIASTTLGTAPISSSFTVTVNYFSTYPPTGSPLACTQGSGPATTPAAAQILSVGDTAAAGTFGHREMEALVNLTVIPATSFDHAIFSNGTLTLNNSTHLNGSAGSGNNADVYSNSDITCNNSSTLHGSILTQGNLVLNNACTTYGNWWAKGSVTDNNGSTVTGNVTSSQSSILFNNRGSVGGDVLAHTTVNCAGANIAQGHVCRANQQGLANPPSETMPQLNFVSASWTSAGFNVNPLSTDCSTNGTVQTEITNMATAITPQVVQTNCNGGPLIWNNNTTISLKQDLAIFSTNGFIANNNLHVMSADGANHKIYMIVPYSVGAPGCSGHDITFNNQASFDATITMFLYTPCHVTVNNNAGGSGQIYGGVVTVNNNFNLIYSAGVVPGDPGGSSGAFNANLVYKREVPAP